MPTSRVFGVEVPIPGTDSMKWIELAISSTCQSSNIPIVSPPTHDCSSCSTVGQPPRHIVWRIHKSKPRIIELFEFAADEEFSGVGLRISFPGPLFSRVCICENKGNLRFPYFLYAMTVSGVLYLLQMRDISFYESCGIFPPEDLKDCDISSLFDNVTITSVSASLGCFFVGRSDGIVLSFQLGNLDPDSPEFIHELRDDVRFGRLWGFVSRSKGQGPVQDMVLFKVNGLSYLFVLHLDGCIRAWDLSNRTRLLCHSLNVSNSAGLNFIKLWIVEDERSIGEFPLATLCFCDEGGYIESIYFSKVYFSPLGASFSIGPTKHSFTLDDGRCIDAKVTLNRLFILKDNGLITHDLSHDSYPPEEMSYRLQEEYIADRLCQLSEQSLDGLSFAIHSAVSSVTDRVASFISLIFLRKLLHSAIYHQAAMRSTLMHYGRHFGDAEFQTLTLEGLKNEICSLVEREDIGCNSSLLLANWGMFCRCYFNYWCETNFLCGLVVDSSANVVGVIRNSSLSAFRELEPVEQLFDEISRDSLNIMSDNYGDSELIMTILELSGKLSTHWGESASVIFYESVVCMPINLTKDVFACLTNILEYGCSSSYSLGTSDDSSREKMISYHKRWRKLSVDILLTLNSLLKKASSWSIVLSSIENFLQCLVPLKLTHKLLVEFKTNVNSTICVQAMSQISKLMLETSINIFLFASYLCKNGRQIQMTVADLSRVHLELCPMIQEIIFDWLVIDFLISTPSVPLSLDDFNRQLSSLKIENVSFQQSWRDKLGKHDFKLVHIVLLTNEISTHHQHLLSSNDILNGESVVNLAQDFFSWFLWGNSGDEAASFFNRSIGISLVLFRHSQFNAVELLLKIIETNYQKEKTYCRFQDTDGDWCVLQHMLGCCFLAQARHELNVALRDEMINESICCLFRASSGQCALKAFISLSRDAGLPTFDFDDHNSSEIWKLQYYQWAMQLFEQYEFSEGASVFALAALEEVDDTYVRIVENGQRDSIMTVKGRLWANVFKFMLDLNYLEDAFCALLTNPDEDSKSICLRRFIVVIFERGALKVLCDGKLPFVGLADKIEQELAWKAERSNVLSKPSPYKLLYAFEMQRHNWRNAASYMIHYSRRLRMEAFSKDGQNRSSTLNEILNAISTAINALNLVNSQNSWIDLPPDNSCLLDNNYPSKKFKETNDSNVVHNMRKVSQYYVSVKDLENEFVLTSAEYLLSMTNNEWKSDGHRAPSVLVDFLVEANLYDMALTVIVKLWNGSSLVKELERFFSSMSLQYCTSKINSSNSRNQGSPNSDMVVYESGDALASSSSSRQWNVNWDTLELYLRKCKSLHAGLPLTLAETLLRADPQMELPLWLVHMFKSSEKYNTWGMAGQESNPASLFRLYVSYGRYTEATNLLMEYINSYASVKPSDLYYRKKPLSSWFPYTVIERLYCHIDDLMRAGHAFDQCDKLKKLLHAALQKHVQLLKFDGEDAVASASV